MAKRTLLKKIAYMYEKLQCHILVLIITPGIFVFEMTIVRSALTEVYKLGIPKQLMHVFLSTFCFINVLGNILLSIFTDTSLKRQPAKVNDENRVYCELCKMNRPAKSWHCDKCNTCILRRDHHCFYFSRCIGLYNQRYYLLSLAYVAISMLYSSYYNFYFLLTKYDEHSLVATAFRILNPLLRYVTPEPMGLRDIYMSFLFLNLILTVWCSCLLSFHLTNVIKGVTAYECRRKVGDKSKWKENLIRVFGTRWYLAILWPFVDSHLPQINDICSKEK